MNWLTSGLLALSLVFASLTTSHATTSPNATIPVPSRSVSTPTVLKSSQSTLAVSALEIDLTTGREIYAKDIYRALPMASLTKLMTAYIVLKEHALTDVVTIDSSVQALDGTGSQTLGLVVGDKITVRQGLDALLVYSANDMAVSFAAWDAGSEPAFVAKMNQAAQMLGMKETHFANASGLDGVNHVSSARDLATIAQIMLQSSTVREVVQQRSASFTTQLGKTYKFATTNQLLANPSVKGMKTGFTAAAGQCLIAYAEREGHAILTVVLGSTDRFGDTAQLLQASNGI